MRLSEVWPWPFIVVAAVGLAASVLVHFCALMGMPNPFGGTAWALHGGVFVVWIPALLVGMRLTHDFKRRDFWRAALRGCPTWLRYGMGAFFVYTFFNFGLFLLSTTSAHGKPSESAELRGFSGHWMAFYAAAIAILYSSTRAEAYDRDRRCANGHAVSPLAKFCEECGAPVAANLA